jgi:hypothetical protein
MKYTVEMGTGTRSTKFHENWFRHSKVDVTCLFYLFFFKNRDLGEQK